MAEAQCDIMFGRRSANQGTFLCEENGAERYPTGGSLISLSPWRSHPWTLWIRLTTFRDETHSKDSSNMCRNQPLNQHLFWFFQGFSFIPAAVYCSCFYTFCDSLMRSVGFLWAELRTNRICTNKHTHTHRLYQKIVPALCGRAEEAESTGMQCSVSVFPWKQP